MIRRILLAALPLLASPTQAQPTDRAVLVEFYNATGGANWTDNTNWTSDQPLDSWYGVNTNATGQVTELSLQDNGLSGEIPAELGNLTNLTRLELAFNGLTGSIPAELGDLASLTELALYGNELSGEIPAELGNLTNLTRLSLSINKLSGEIPAELGDLMGLTDLVLNNNELTGAIPVELGNLTGLTRLTLSTNQLTGAIPVELGNLTSLTQLWLNTNQLTGAIPMELGNLTSLTVLYLFGNQLSGSIPVELGKLTSLQYLYLANNQLTGAIPAELGNLASLQSLWLSANQLSGSIPVELGKLTSLTRLILSLNELSGSIPVELGNLTSLTRLILSLNELSGSIPVELGNLTSLTGLSLVGNQLSGSIPVELGKLISLTGLYLGGNKLTGEIPVELRNLTSLDGLNLYGNELSGEIPTELGDLTSLTLLSLGSNKLTGSIPVELGNLTSLGWLYLQENELSGSIPAELGNLTGLRWLWLHDNQLTGEIPVELASLTNLADLALATNRLTGEIPVELGTLASLSWLSVYGNPQLYNYPANLNARGDLHVVAPSDGRAACLPTTQGGNDCTIPTLVDNLSLTAGPAQIVVRWEPNPASPAPTGYEVEYPSLGAWTADNVSISGTTATITGLTPGRRYSVRVRTTDSPDPSQPDLRTPWLSAAVTLPLEPPMAAITTDAECSEPAGGLPISNRHHDARLCRAVTGQAVRFEDSSTGAGTSRLWDFGDGQTSERRTVEQTWSAPGFYEVTLRVGDGTVSHTASLTFLVEAANPAGTCVADEQTLCLRDSRFAVEMDWSAGDGRSGPGLVARAGTNDSGLFYFFEPGNNWEVLVKVLDGCSVNGHAWVYAASATTLGYRIRVTDTVTDAVREYTNEHGSLADAITDGQAFPDACGVASPPTSRSADAAPLRFGRFEVSMTWATDSGATGPGRPAGPRTADSGLFWFFGPDNWEALVKVLDGCEVNGHVWVFMAAATDLGLELTVTDTETGRLKRYVRDPGAAAPAIADVGAFLDACEAPAM